MTPPHSAFEDSVLIEMILAGQAEYFNVLMDRHLAALGKCVASMVRNVAEREDLLQEVVIKVWRHLASFRSESSFRTWANRVAVNEVLQSYRRQRCRPLLQLPMDADAFASPGESQLTSLVRSETTKTVRRAVAQLPEKYQQVLVLRDLEQLSSLETARCLESTVPAVKSRLFRARNMLSKALRSRPMSDARKGRSAVAA